MLQRHGARNRHPLSLSAAQLHATVADGRLIPVGKRFNESIRVRQASGADNVIVRNVIATAVRYIVPEGATKQSWILCNDANLSTMLMKINGSQVDTVDENATLSWIIEPLQQIDNSAFATT